MNSANLHNYEREFQRAWADPGNTQVELPPVDVNAVLARHYRMSEPLIFTRTMLWDMEVRKAWRPDLYIPSVVQEGTASAWRKRSAGEGIESFMRSSEQRLWLEPAEFGSVLEQVCVNSAEQRVTFIGAMQASDQNGNRLGAGRGQPLFHVEHSVSGTESRPLNNWRIVHLTNVPDSRLVERFSLMAESVWLPEFIEIYIRKVLNIELSRRNAQETMHFRRASNVIEIEI